MTLLEPYVLGGENKPSPRYVQSTKYRSTFNTNGEIHIPYESEEEYENGVCGVFTVMSSVCQKPRAE